MIDLCGGIEKVADIDLCYYNYATDSYIDFRAGHVPIKLKNGAQLSTRKEVIKIWENNDEK